ncbi:triple tyrosine motif-containing protein, partial [Arthrospira platensis SPKY1]|nr:triple tyrosine motif-containing protein [Arthrospira platensis SPKY1]
TPLREQLRIHPGTQLLGVSAGLQPLGLASGQVLPHYQNSLAFDYVGLWFTAPAGVRYRYRLDGFDRDWRYTSDQRVVYSNLPPGRYVFRVASTENETFGAEPVLAYAFAIRQPYWR